MKATRCLFLYFLLAPAILYGGNSPFFPVDSIRNAFIRQIEVFPQEKIYLHTDKSGYFLGDTIWFKTYLVDAVVHLPSEHSKFVYVELINPGDSVVDRAKIRIASGQSHGQIRIPYTFSEGNYLLRAYAGTMYEMDENYFFHKTITITSPLSSSLTDSFKQDKKKDYDLSFFAEGGNLLEGVPCKIAFKAIKANGLAENVKGYISDNEGHIVLPAFESLHKGMGSFVLLPEKGKKYHAVIENDEGRSRRFELPLAVNNAYALSTQWNGNKIGITVKHSSGVINNDSLFLLVHLRGVAYYAASLDPDIQTLELSAERFPSGVLQILLMDANRNPLSERLMFCNKQDQAHVLFQPDKNTYKTREPVNVRVKLSNPEGIPLTGNFSVSVTGNGIPVDSTTNILTYLLLTSDLKGYIEDPAFYFRAEKALPEKALDNLMLTQGWRRYNLPEIMKNNWTKLPGFVELGQEITGNVKGLIRNKGISNGRVSIISLTNPYFNEVTTGERGDFSFTGLNFPDDTEFLVQARSSKGSERVNLTVYKDSFPEFKSRYSYMPVLPVEKFQPIENEVGLKIKEDFINGIRLIQLKEVEIRANRVNQMKENPFLLFSDKTFDSNYIKKNSITSLREMLQRVAGVRFYNNQIYIRSRMSIYRDNPAAFAIDGIIINSFDEEDNKYDRDMDGFPQQVSAINVSDIERVDIFKTAGSTVVWGSRAGSGLISIITKKGRRMSDPLSVYNTKQITPLGYQIPVEFYSPKYETDEQKKNGAVDYRSTLFWNPNISTDEEGNASFGFYTSDEDSIFSVVIEGITDSGEVVSYRDSFNCIK